MTAEKNFIFYIDDDEDDRELLTEALQNAYPAVHLEFAVNGLVALHCLQELKEKGGKLPDLIILDLNMPFLDGKDTFLHLKHDCALQHIPVVVFTSSEKPSDRSHFQDQGVEFFTKPSHITFLREIVRHLLEKHCGPSGISAKIN